VSPGRVKGGTTPGGIATMLATLPTPCPVGWSALVPLWPPDEMRAPTLTMPCRERLRTVMAGACSWDPKVICMGTRGGSKG
jgi:hypothetical protein